MDIIEFISQPWHWAVSGALIALVMFLLLLSGERFGISSSFETICTIAGAGKITDYFRVNWKEKAWLLVFAGGSMIGGYIGVTWLQSPEPVQIAQSTSEYLSSIGVVVPQSKDQGLGFMPLEIFSFSSLLTLKGFIFIVVGGFLIGFGTRWAGGCTSGHAISGLANLQLPSMIAVIGFFIGGLITTYFLIPLIMNL